MTTVAELTAPGAKQVLDNNLRHIAARDLVHEFEVRMEKPKPLQSGSLLFGAIQDQRLRLKKPVPVEIFHTPDSSVAHCPDLNEFGYGSMASEALDDLGKTLSELFLSLEQQKGQLGEDLEKLRNRLADYIEFSRY